MGRAPTGTVELVVLRGKQAVMRSVLTIRDGEIPGVAEGPAEAPDVVLSLTPQDAEAMRAGALDPNVAYMRGTMKMAGDNGVLLAVLPVLHGPAWAAVREQALSPLA